MPHVDSRIAVVVRHTKLSQAEEEDILDHKSMEDWEKSLQRQLIPRKEFAAFLERLSYNPSAERVDLIVSFYYWPEFVLVQIYDGYIE